MVHRLEVQYLDTFLVIIIKVIITACSVPKTKVNVGKLEPRFPQTSRQVLGMFNYFLVEWPFINNS